ncbi:MAG: DUF916 domain-containing protein [Patescibacteria group bacterium]
MKRTTFLIALSLAVMGLFTAESALAQGSAGIGIKPATIEEPAVPGEEKQYTVTVSNLADVEQTIYLFKRDIIGVRDGGVPVFANENTEKTGFELSEWIELSTEEITLGASSEQEVSFTLRVPEDASPGSHFGGVFVSVDPPRLRTVGAAVGYEVANIVSIRVAGDAVESAQLRSFSTDNYIYGSTDVAFTATIRNAGNVLVRPFGPLEVFNMFGERVALLTLNESEGGVFPGTDRDFVVSWEDEGPGFGRYNAVVSLTYGADGRKSTIFSTVSFWILPMDIIGPALGVLAVLLLATYFGVRAYIRRTLAAYGGGRRLVRRRQSRGTSTLFMVMIVMLVVTALFLIVLLLLFA